MTPICLILWLWRLTVPALASGPSDAVRLTRSYTQHLAAPPREVFPLLGPLGEKRWAHAGWDPRFHFPPGGADEQGCVFTTRNHGVEILWVLLVFDARRLAVEYLQIVPGNRVADLRIALAPEGAGRTAARITYTWTALSEAGRDFLAAHSGPAFDQAMAGWESEVNAYLTRGQRK